jgi:hypothetical protein
MSRQRKWRESCSVGVVLFCALAPLGADEKSEWKEFAPKESGISIKFPTKPVLGKVGTGEDQMQTAAVKRAAVKALGYTLYWRTMKKPYGSAAEAEAYMKNQQKGVVESGKLVSEEKVPLGEHKGRELTVTVNEATTLRCRVFVIGKLVCTLVVQGQSPDAVKSDDAERFLKSLKLSREKQK